ncbi:hypothetical protein [Streptomyces scopuliridis]
MPHTPAHSVRARVRTAVITAADDGRWITVYCAACGGHKPMGHGCQ